jgi:hypothetical protein
VNSSQIGASRVRDAGTATSGCTRLTGPAAARPSSIPNSRTSTRSGVQAQKVNGGVLCDGCVRLTSGLARLPGNSRRVRPDPFLPDRPGPCCADGFYGLGETVDTGSGRHSCGGHSAATQPAFRSGDTRRQITEPGRAAGAFRECAEAGHRVPASTRGLPWRRGQVLERNGCLFVR